MPGLAGQAQPITQGVRGIEGRGPAATLYALAGRALGKGRQAPLRRIPADPLKGISQTKPKTVGRRHGLVTKRRAAPRVAQTLGFDKPAGVGVPLSVGGWVALLLVLLFPGSAPAQAPDDEWRTLSTANFRVTFSTGLEAVAARAAERAERAHASLTELLPPAPDGPIDLIITDHVDVSNGFAALFPSNRVTIYARPPVDGFGLQYFDDWLELVIAHELVHVFHLDRTSAFGGLLRTVFGRVPSTWPLFPEAALPSWATEGVATYYESRMTEAGRVRGTYHDMVLRVAALEDRFETVDQALGQSPVWPLGDRAYAYGSRMLAHLAEDAGDEGVAAFVEAVRSQWIPFRLDAAAKDGFGRSFTAEWSAFRDAYSRRAEEAPSGQSLLPVTEGGYLQLYPRPGPDGGVAYARADGRSDTQLRLIDAEGGEAAFRTNGVSAFDWSPDGSVVFHQREFLDPYRVRNDLYVRRPDGAIRRVTRGARVSYPTLTPDGRSAVAVQEEPGGNRLVEVDIRTGEIRPLAAQAGAALYAYPRLSPDGRWIAVSRWTSGAHYDIVILDRDGRTVARVTGDRAIDQTPTWSPDGRWLVFASDRSGVANLYATAIGPGGAPVGPLRRVTDVATGAIQPAVDEAGAWIYAAVYHADGWRIERVPFRPDEWEAAAAPDVRFRARAGGPEARYARRLEGPMAEYSPWEPLRPRYWVPLYTPPESHLGRRVFGHGLGLRTSGSDLVGRHGYALFAEYETEGSRVTGGLSYEYAGLGVPRLGISLFQRHDADGFRVLTPDSVPTDVFLVERERGVSISARFDRRRIRSVAGLTLSGAFLEEERRLLDALLEPSRDFSLRDPDSPLWEAGFSAFYANTRQYAFSLSPEAGWSLGVAGRVRRETGLADTLRSVAGADDGFRELTGSARTYLSFPLWGFANHVLAVRLAGGAAAGSGADLGHFEVGGAAGRPQTVAGLVRVGGAALRFPVRGYSRESRFGRYAWTAAAEYRFPIALVHRGWRTLPLHLDRLWGSVFLDAGNAWGPSGASELGTANPRRSTLVSAGAELSATVLPLWTSSLHLRVGVGVPLDDGAAGPQFYVRLGNVF